jgi:hypothetical protein
VPPHAIRKVEKAFPPAGAAGVAPLLYAYTIEEVTCFNACLLAGVAGSERVPMGFPCHLSRLA